MNPLDQNAGLTERVYQAILNDILDGDLAAGQHLVQEQLAEKLQVSRQPVQQAMTLLKADGLVQQVGRRGLMVALLDLSRMRNHYDLRGLIDGYAARQAAMGVASGRIDKSDGLTEFDRMFRKWKRTGGRAATREQIQQDEVFHRHIYAMSGNTVIEEVVAPHWQFLRRAMADVLRYAEPSANVWDQHIEIAETILAGKAEQAETLAVEHTRKAATALAHALESGGGGTGTDMSAR